MNHTEALHLMCLAPAMLETLQAFVAIEDAFDRGEVTFTERAELRAKALADARLLISEVNQETNHAT